MNSALLEQVIDAVLYEGYILYPYRPSSRKNRRERFTFGRVYPESYSIAHQGAEPCLMQTECLVETRGSPALLQVTIRFLQPQAREVGVFDEPWGDRSVEPRWHAVPELRFGDEVFQTWHEAVERRVECPPFELNNAPSQERMRRFGYEAKKELEPVIRGDNMAGLLLRHHPEIRGTVELAWQQLKERLFKLTVRVRNQTPYAVPDSNEGELLLRTMASTHTILQAQNAQFVSLMDPGECCRELAGSCKNLGTWPVLVGDEALGERDAMLSSPIILYDYPKVAPESPGPLFDGTEIDEILSLRILTMTDQEKMEMRQVDAQARRLLERTEALDQAEFWQLHGITRPPARRPDPVEFDDFFGGKPRLDSVLVSGVTLRAGDRVRVWPKGRADLIDLALEGRTAVIASIEEDLEGCKQVAVAFEDDPGKDLGLDRQPGHRFFYRLDEIEPVRETVS